MPKIKTNRGAAKRFKATGSEQDCAKQGLCQPYSHQEEYQEETESAQIGPCGRDEQTERLQARSLYVREGGRVGIRASGQERGLRPGKGRDTRRDLGKTGP